MEEGKLNKLFPFGESDVGDKKGNIRQEAMVVNNKKKIIKKKTWGGGIGLHPRVTTGEGMHNRTNSSRIHISIYSVKKKCKEGDDCLDVVVISMRMSF